MQFVEGVDYGDAPEIHISGISTITKISEHMVRVTFFTEKAVGDAIENRVVVHLVWDMANWLVSQAAVHHAMGSFVKEILASSRDAVAH